MKKRMLSCNDIDKNSKRRMKFNFYFLVFIMLLLSMIYYFVNQDEVLSYILIVSFISFPAYVIGVSPLMAKK
ncbi:hypothetical protein GCFR_02039 [Citrobacter freundii ATCC 8090 = MTCC 1658 = NBRC 12681]|nr:hypothetical protein D186_23137 [Citrobacter freundii ATCC 8090 = MTCC 1658 = NBRC 12681]EXF30887.1 hypothetical protein V172_09710 [Citrobacter freundii RLS1]KFB97772.1 hypothetical protein GCFR_02039 [Citrobacter freundii ATCC 8090 = MTCC 1658 = NBRC 12681]GAL38480.1 hypothetical protein CIFRE_01_01670 [Citrobacter freundii ATCC 8090 = MTCC 1658 = NBRC 12681]VDZ54382.1 Uncharacterised protein [Citrobacter freundii]